MAKTIRFKIVGNSYQSVSTIVNDKLFYTPKKGQSVTIDCAELPASLKDLSDRGVIIVKTVDK